MKKIKLFTLSLCHHNEPPSFKKMISLYKTRFPKHYNWIEENDIAIQLEQSTGVIQFLEWSYNNSEQYSYNNSLNQELVIEVNDEQYDEFNSLRVSQSVSKQIAEGWDKSFKILKDGKSWEGISNWLRIRACGEYYKCSTSITFKEQSDYLLARLTW